MTDTKDNGFVKLVTVYDQFNVTAIGKILDELNIEYKEKHGSIDESLAQILGDQLSGTDLMVKEEDLKDARKAINEVLAIDFSGYEQEEESENSK